MPTLKTWLVKKLLPLSEQSDASHRLQHLEQAVERYRTTDAKRQLLHRKLKDRLKSLKRESALIKQEASLLRKNLANITVELQSSKLFCENFAPILPRLGDAAHTTKSADRWSYTPRRARLERRAWTPSMRLGVLHQHAPQPFSVPPPPLRALPASPPVISIVTPSWQQAAYLPATMDSVLSQAYPNLQYIVMDGGSTDGSKEIIQQRAAHLTHWQSAKDGGQSKAIHAGFAHATGDIMAWLNSDDLYLSNTLAYVAHYFAHHPEVDAVYGHRALINPVGHEIGRWYLPPHDGTMLLWADYIPQETWFWRRRIYEKCGGIDPSKQFAMDWDLLLRMQHAGAIIHRLPAFLGCFRVHDSQKSQAIIHDVGAAEGSALRQRELGPHFTQTELNLRCTQFQLRALRTQRLWELGLRSTKW